MLEALEIEKSYGGVHALRGVSFAVRAGSVHALLGENGAGKTTLVKVIAGAVRPDAGVVRLDGAEVSFSSTAEAVRKGVAVVTQELSLFGDLDVLGNLYPMREPKRGPFIDRRQMVARAVPVMADLGLDVPLRRPLRELSLAQRQLVEIARALITEPRVLILDEPTSALEASSTETLMKALDVLRERDVAVVFVSHILEEAMQLCDEVTVLRDGRLMLEAASKEELSVPAIVEAMIGDRREGGGGATEGLTRRLLEPIDQAVDGAAAGAPAGALSVERVSTKKMLEDVSFTAPGGEILGVAGLTGAGHVAVIELVTGQRRPDSGKVVLPSGKLVPRGLRAAIRAGVALVTGDRRRFGLMLDKPLWDNIGQVRAVALGDEGIAIRKRKLREHARQHVERLRVRTPSVNERVDALSGGNQQKVVFAKWLDANPAVMVLDDPTRGVDVGAKAEMHALIRSAAKAGAVVLLSSTDLDELCLLCDRVLVFFGRRICAELTGTEKTVRTLLEAMNTGAPTARAV